MVFANVYYGWYSYWSGTVPLMGATVKLVVVEELKELEGLKKLDELHEGPMCQLLV